MSDLTRAIQSAVKELEGPDGWCREQLGDIAALVATLLGQDVTPELERVVPVVLRRMVGYSALLRVDDPPPPAWSKTHANKQARQRRAEVEVVWRTRRRGP